MRKKIVAANWKMNLDIDKALDYLSYMDSRDIVSCKQNADFEIILFPSSIYLATFVEKIQNTIHNPIAFNNNYERTFKLGVQNAHYEKSGAYTGEISLQQIKSIGGIDYILVGHSERRQYFNETDNIVKQKVDACIENNFTPIACVGESIEIRNSGKEKEYVVEQIKQCLFHLSKEQIQKCVIAYEPIWAIGTGKSATSDQAEEMHKTIRECISNKYSKNTAEQISILYGGSCTPENAKELFSCPNIDGGLVGGASLDKMSFHSIIEKLSICIKHN